MSTQAGFSENRRRAYLVRDRVRLISALVLGVRPRAPALLQSFSAVLATGGGNSRLAICAWRQIHCGGYGLVCWGIGQGGNWVFGYWCCGRRVRIWGTMGKDLG